MVALRTVDEDIGARIRQHAAECRQAAIMEKDLACDIFITLSLQYHCLMVAKKSVIIIIDNEISLI